MNNTNPLLEQAETYYSKAISSFETNIGFIKKFNVNNYEQAMESCRRALELWLAVLGEDTSEDDESELDFGELFVEGPIPPASAFERIYNFLPLLPSIGIENEEPAAVYVKIGDIYAKMCKKDKASEYFEKAMFSRNNPSAAKWLNFIGNAYHDMFDDDKALEYLTKALNQVEQDENVYAAVLNNIGGVISFDEPEKSLECFEKAERILSAAFGENDVNVAAVHYNMGCAYYYKKEFKAAYKHLKSSNKVLCNVFEEDSNHTFEYRELIRLIGLRRFIL